MKGIIVMFKIKFRTSGVLMVVICIIFAFQVSVFAYSSTAYSDVYELSGNIEFIGRYTDDAPPTMIKSINYYSESLYYTAVIASASMGDDTHTYNNFSSTYTKTNPSPGAYQKYTIGHTSYEPPIQYINSDSASDVYNYEGSKSIYTNEVVNFLDTLHQDIAKAFDIDLSNYVKINSFLYKEANLFGIEKQLSLQYGDIYAIYLNNDNSAGIVLKQDLKGVYTLYEFIVNKNSKIAFGITNIDQVQGEYKFIDDYFLKNPNPPTITYKAEGSTLQVIIKDNN